MHFILLRAFTVIFLKRKCVKRAYLSTCLSPPIHNAFRWGNIHLWHGWQKAFCFLYPRWSRPRLTVLSQQDVWMLFHLPLQQLLSLGSPSWQKMAVFAQTGRGFMAMHSMWFTARQRFHLCWISTAESRGVAAWGEGHSSEDPSMSHAVPLLSYLDCISASLLQWHYVLLPRHILKLLMSLHLKKKPNAAV